MGGEGEPRLLEIYFVPGDVRNVCLVNTGGILTSSLRVRKPSPGRLREPLQMAPLAPVPAGGLVGVRLGEKSSSGEAPGRLVVGSPHREGLVSFKEPRPPCSS